MERNTDPRTAGPAGVIHDLGYHGYSGQRLGIGAISWALTLSGLRSAFGIGRSGKAKVMPFLLLAINTLPALIIVGIVVMVGDMMGRELPLGYTGYVSRFQIVLSLFVAAQAPVLFSADQQSGAISLYLARPASSAVYALSRFASMLLATLVFLWSPILLLWVGSLLAELDVTENLKKMLVALLLSFLLAVAVSGVASLIASWSTRRGFAVVGTIGVLLILNAIVMTVAALAASASNYKLAQWAGLFSPYSLYRGVCTIVGADTFDYPPQGLPLQVLYFLGLIGIGVGCVVGLIARYRKVASR